MKKSSKNGIAPRAEYKVFTSLADLTPDPKNARKHTPRNVGTIVDALHEVGAARSIVIDENGVVLAGNATMDAAIEAGLSKVQVVDADGETVIAVRRSGLTAKQKTRLALYDNRAAELAEWNPEILAELVDTKELEGMFSDKELAEILSEIETEPKDAEPQIDKAEELRQKWGTETGQLWVIGNHRLLVGDATNKADVGLLCANDKPLLMVTDPPYGVEYDPHWRHEAAAKGLIGFGAKRDGKVENDDRIDWGEAFRLFTGDVVYVWHAGRHASEVQRSLESSAFEIRCQLIWVKNSFSISRGHYNWQHEPCWYAVRKGKQAGWIGNASEATTWEINKNDGNDQGSHGTQKPLECMARPIRNHSGDVYDPFVGSGTTLVAAENLNRKCYAMEISPAYVAVCLERMTTAFPHLKIEKADKAQAA